MTARSGLTARSGSTSPPGASITAFGAHGRRLARIASPLRRGLAIALAVSAGIALATPAEASEGTVTGELTLAPESQRGPPPTRTLGFVSRAYNPLKPPRRYDPRPHLVVVLEGGPAATGARADRVEYPIVGAAFEAPILPVQVDVPFGIINRSSHSPRLFAVGAPDVLSGDPLNPGGTRSGTISTPYRAFDVRDRDSAHINAVVVAFPHPHFSRVDDAGRFEIADVPAGTYTARIWYRGGWLDIRPEQVTVSAGGRARVEIAVPPRLEVKGPDSEGANE